MCVLYFYLNIVKLSGIQILKQNTRVDNLVTELFLFKLEMKRLAGHEHEQIIGGQIQVK